MEKETRVRMNVELTAKGLVTFSVTAETPTVEESSKLLGEAVDQLKKEVEQRGMKLAAAA